MILNPNNNKSLSVFPGTRILMDDLNLLGLEITDPNNRERIWRIDSVYAPIQQLDNQGIRVKVTDNFGVISFIPQMDLEVLLDVATPGDICLWNHKVYKHPRQNGFLSPYMNEEEDMEDDLLDMDLITMGSYPRAVSIEVTRYYHFGYDEERKKIFHCKHLFPSIAHTIYSIGKKWVEVEEKPFSWRNMHGNSWQTFR